MKIVLCATKNMYQQLYASINMLISTQPRLQHIYAIVETDHETDLYSSDLVTFINIKNYDKVMSNTINKNNKWTYMCFARCYLTEILDEDKIIYLDLDTVALGDISELWDMDIDNYSLAGVLDKGISFERNMLITPYIDDRERYINTGVLVMNLKFIREHNLDVVIDSLLRYQKLSFPDQDCLNMACHDTIKLIGGKWNFSPVTRDEDKPIIIHDIIDKPWNPNSILFRLWSSYYFNKDI